MNDNQLRAIVLKKYYDRRRSDYFQWQGPEFDDIEETIEMVDLYRACDQLGEHGLIDWKSVQGIGGSTVAGYGEITAFGVDVIEGTARSPISMNFDHSQNFTRVLPRLYVAPARIILDINA